MKTNIRSLGDATFALVVKKQNAHLTLKHETQGRLLSAKSNIQSFNFKARPDER